MSATAQVEAPQSAPEKKKNPLSKFSVQIVLGLIVGVVLGGIAAAMGQVGAGDDAQPNWLAATLQQLGSSYVGLLKLLVVPLVVTAVISSIARLREVANAARLALQTLLWFAITSFASVLVGIGVGLVTRPSLTGGVTGATEAVPSYMGSWTAFLTGLLPENIFGLGCGFRAMSTPASAAASPSTCCRSWCCPSPSASLH